MDRDHKQYQSYHTLSPREYMYFPRGTLDMGKPGQFSKLELMHLGLAILVLTIGFSFALTQSSLLMMYLFNEGFNLGKLFFGLELSFVGVMCAFVVHELSHKLMAQKLGLWSEFRMYPKGLVTSLILSVTTGFVLAAPGAVMFRGEPRLFEQGKIATAGPSANIILSALFYAVYQLFLSGSVTILSTAIMFIFVINAILGFFNLLPFGPLDGVLIYKYNKIIWATLFLSSLILISIIIQFVPYIYSFIF